MTALYLNQRGIAKISHEPCYMMSGNANRYTIYILISNAWEPIRLPLCFPSQEAAEAHLGKLYDAVELVPAKRFDPLVRNLSVLPRGPYTNCY